MVHARAHRSVPVLALLLLAALILAACAPRMRAASEPRASAPAPEAAAASLPATMPDLTGRTLKEVAGLDWIGDLGSDQVSVSFPAQDAEWTVDATVSAGIHYPARTIRHTFPGQTRDLHSVRTALQVISGQSPRPGAPLSADTTVTLVAGPHPNDTHKPWITTGHVAAVNRDGPISCLEPQGCHGPTECAYCHATQV